MQQASAVLPAFSLFGGGGGGGGGGCVHPPIVQIYPPSVFQRLLHLP